MSQWSVGAWRKAPPHYTTTEGEQRLNSEGIMDTFVDISVLLPSHSKLSASPVTGGHFFNCLSAMNHPAVM